MRRLVSPALALPALMLALTGCTGFGEFLSHTFSPPGTNPNRPGADSATVRRVLGLRPEVEPLRPEEGNVWPAPEPPSPTLTDIARDQGNTTGRGFEPTVVPGAEPGLPAGRQPRPAARGSTPAEPTQPGTPGPTSIPQVQAPPPPSSAPGPGPQGNVVQTPRGPAVDTGGTRGYRQLNTPQGPGAILIPNGNGTSTLIRPDGSVETVPTPGR